jgi:hypothetical protein
MDKSGLVRLSKEIGRFSIPSYVQSFLRDNPDVKDFSSAYDLLLSYVPVDVPRPSLNEALLYYNLLRLQSVADAKLQALRIHGDRLVELEKNPDKNRGEIVEIKRYIGVLEQKLHELTRDLMKYSSSGVDRETPKQINVTQVNLDLGSIHEKIREIKGNLVGDDDD